MGEENIAAEPAGASAPPPAPAPADADEQPGAAHPDAAAEEPRQGPVFELDLATLAARAAERDEYLALAQRTRADFENYRKRVARDAGAAEARGVAKLVRELLPAIDNLERALAAAPSEPPAAEGDVDPGRHVIDGMRLVRDDLRGALGRAGVESYDPQGEPFDPALHEAIAHYEVPGAAPGTVVEVYQAGYRLNTSVIRPARVVVAAAPAAAATSAVAASDSADEDA